MDKKVTFEDKMKELESLIRKIEDKALPLEEAISTYEAANKLIEEMEKELISAKERVEKATVAQEEDK